MDKDRRWNYFTPREVEGLNEEFVAMLDRARHISGIPFIITSGIRSETHNKEIGGVPDSSHLEGLAVDLLCTGSVQRFKLVTALIAVGFKRIGLYLDGHIHVDLDMNKAQNVIWLK